MDESRRRLLLASAAASAAAIALAACGGGGGGGYGGMPPPPPPPPPPGGLSCGASAISNNHGHALTIPTADLDSMVDMTYHIQGTADHDHTITLTPAQLQEIKAKGVVTVASTFTNSYTYGLHNHAVTVTCM